MGIGVEAVITDHNLSLIGDVGSDTGYELQIIHRLFLGVIFREDPDAPMGTWVHWILFNLPANINELSEDVPTDKKLESGAKPGRNDFRKIGYVGPCPPGGTHRYYFKLCALDTELNPEAGVTKSQLLEAMEGHIFGEGQLMGKYKR
jgi:Raf kinase inhibitor-like YbhB/YbcL family protein